MEQIQPNDIDRAALFYSAALCDRYSAIQKVVNNVDLNSNVMGLLSEVVKLSEQIGRLTALFGFEPQADGYEAGNERVILPMDLHIFDDLELGSIGKKAKILYPPVSKDNKLIRKGHVVLI